MEPSAFGQNTTRQQLLNCPQQQEHLSLPHNMPLPTSAPWNRESMPWTVATKSMEQQGGVMQFRAQSTLQQSSQKRSLHFKRKSDIAAAHPPKQFISEEKITAHFNGLHISSDYIQLANDDLDASLSGLVGERPTSSGKSFTNLTYHDYQVTAKELEEKLKRANRITMCDEIKKMNEEQNKVSFLPHALLGRIEKPCTALVLWQPTPILELLQKTDTGEENCDISLDSNNDIAGDVEEATFYEPDAEIDDFIDNNNTCNLDFNNLKLDGMETDV